MNALYSNAKSCYAIKYKIRRIYRLLLNVLPPFPAALGAGTSFLAAAVRFPAAAAVKPVALLTAFLTTPVFRTIVVCALESLV